MSVNRRLSITFDGLPSIRTMRTELDRLAKYMPVDTQLAGIEDNGSTNPELREITLDFEKEGYIHG